MSKKIRKEVSEFLELPLDVSLDLPRVVVLGNLGVFIENHRGLMQYSATSMVVGVGSGQISIKGKSLEVEEIGKEDVVVRGIIKAVYLEV